MGSSRTAAAASLRWQVLQTRLAPSPSPGTVNFLALQSPQKISPHIRQWCRRLHHEKAAWQALQLVQSPSGCHRSRSRGDIPAPGSGMFGPSGDRRLVNTSSTQVAEVADWLRKVDIARELSTLLAPRRRALADVLRSMLPETLLRFNDGTCGERVAKGVVSVWRTGVTGARGEVQRGVSPRGVSDPALKAGTLRKVDIARDRLSGLVWGVISLRQGIVAWPQALSSSDFRRFANRTRCIPSHLSSSCSPTSSSGELQPVTDEQKDELPTPCHSIEGAHGLTGEPGQLLSESSQSASLKPQVLQEVPWVRVEASIVVGSVFRCDA